MTAPDRTGWVDLHNHVIPGVDDGARDPADGRAAVAALAGEGVRMVVATPHFDGSSTLDAAALARRLGRLDEGWRRLTAEGGEDGDAEVAGVRVARGVELKLDVPEVDLSDPRLRLAGGPAVLVEFPHMSVPPRSGAALSSIRQSGHIPLLAHPERYHGLGASTVDTAADWLDAGAYLQVNAGSLTGRYGRDAARVALELLARGWVHCLASDYHARGEAGVAAARGLIEEWGGAEQAGLLFETNPSRLLAGELPIPAEPLTRRRSWTHLLRRLVPWR